MQQHVKKMIWYSLFRFKTRTVQASETPEVSNLSSEASNKQRRLKSQLLSAATSISFTSLALSAMVSEEGDCWLDFLAYFLSIFLFISTYFTAYKNIYLFLSKESDNSVNQQLDKYRKRSGILGSIASAWAGANSLKFYLVRSSQNQVLADWVSYGLLPCSVITQVALLWSNHISSPAITEPIFSEKLINILKLAISHIITMAFTIPNLFLFIVALLKTPMIIFNDHCSHIFSPTESAADALLFYLIHGLTIIGWISAQLAYGSLTSNMLGYLVSAREQKIINTMRNIAAPAAVIADTWAGAIGVAGFLQNLGVAYEISLAISPVGALGFAAYSVSIFGQNLIQPRRETSDQTKILAEVIDDEQQLHQTLEWPAQQFTGTRK